MIDLLHKFKRQRQADAYSAEELHERLKTYNVKSPSNKDNELTFPFPFNLMFRTTIGPEGTSVGYLRPETAQGLFVNFRYAFFVKFCNFADNIRPPRVFMAVNEILTPVAGIVAQRDDQNCHKSSIFTANRNHQTIFLYHRIYDIKLVLIILFYFYMFSGVC